MGGCVVVTGSRQLRIVPAREAPRARRRREWDAAAAMLLAVGLVPIAGRIVLGRWPAWELGAGTAMALFAIRQLVARP